jgi:hypothetical protein
MLIELFVFIFVIGLVALFCWFLANIVHYAITKHVGESKGFFSLSDKWKQGGK